MTQIKPRSLQSCWLSRSSEFSSSNERSTLRCRRAEPYARSRTTRLREVESGGADLPETGERHGTTSRDLLPDITGADYFLSRVRMLALWRLSVTRVSRQYHPQLRSFRCQPAGSCQCRRPCSSAFLVPRLLWARRNPQRLRRDTMITENGNYILYAP
jgi:hypothetical protein